MRRRLEQPVDAADDGELGSDLVIAHVNDECGAAQTFCGAAANLKQLIAVEYAE
jgi:hypothetical protein